jgi:polyphosphate kinase
MVKRRPVHSQKERPIAAGAPPLQRFLDRELSHLAFNERVLSLTGRPTVPLAERLR